jgi:hypothetical protein
MLGTVRYLPLVLILAVGVAPAAQAESPEAVLQAAGLKRVGNVWLHPTELAVRDRLAEIDRLDRRFHEARKQVHALIEQSESYKTQLAQLTVAQQRTREGRAAAKNGSPQQKALDEELKQQAKLIEQLKQLIVPPDQLGGTGALKTALMELVEVRIELARNLLAVRELVDRLPQEYQMLATDSKLTKALAALAPPGQFGSGKNYAVELRGLSRLEKLIFNDAVPFYRDGKQPRVTGLVNEELPVTFSFYESNDPTVITYAMAESLGIDLSRALRTTVRLDGKVDLAASQVRLASLRFGRHVVRDVEALVLSPDDESAGARIGGRTLSAIRPRLDAERLLLHLDSAATSAE